MMVTRGLGKKVNVLHNYVIMNFEVKYLMCF